MIMMVGSRKGKGRVSDSWRFIWDNLKLIPNRKRRQSMRILLRNYEPEFINKPASVKHHHNMSGGLVIHTAQVLKYALERYNKFSVHLPSFNAESVYVTAVLHDLAKTQFYVLTDPDTSANEHPYPFTYNKGWRFEHDIWTLSEAEKFGLQLTYDEMMGIMQAHGGWSKLNDPINKLAVIIHCADMLSSQVVKK